MPPAPISMPSLLPSRARRALLILLLLLVAAATSAESAISTP